MNLSILYPMETVYRVEFPDVNWIQSRWDQKSLFLYIILYYKMYGCESWTVKKAERQRIDAFELWCWRRLLSVPWTARRSNLSILKEISPGCSLEGPMLKLKLQYFGHLMRRADSWKRPWCWEGLGTGEEGDNRGWDGWMASLTRGTWVWVNAGTHTPPWWTGRPCMLGFMGSQRVGHDWATELNWTLKLLVWHMKNSPWDASPKKDISNEGQI